MLFAPCEKGTYPFWLGLINCAFFFILLYILAGLATTQNRPRGATGGGQEGSLDSLLRLLPP